MKVTVVLAVILVAYAQEDWMQVSRGDGGRFQFDINEHSLEIVTEDYAGLIAVSFFNSQTGGDPQASVALFSPGIPPTMIMYEIKHCTESITGSVSGTVGAAQTKNWLFDMNSDGLHIKCNGEEVLDVVFARDCTKAQYAEYYSPWPMFMQFDNVDSASVKFRLAEKLADSEETDGVVCGVGEMRCADGEQCIPESYWCDNEEDCDDGSDEGQDVCVDFDCPEGYSKCADGRHCIYTSYFCDTETDCSDGSDEIVSQCREQVPKPDGVLVSIASVEQSSTRPEGDTPYDVSRAIDGDFGTSAGSATSDEEPWMKVTLDRMHCVKQVMWYFKSYAPESTYTCNQDGCVCGGNYCEWSFVTVGVEGGATDSGVPELRAPEDDNSDLDCKYGNMVLFTYDESRSYRSVYFGEIEVSAAPMAQYRITYSIWDDEDARSTDRQYVQIKGTDGVTQEHMCENDFDVINEDVTCVFESKDDIGDYRCVHLRIGGRDGIDITQVTVEIDGEMVHEFGAQGEAEYFDLDNYQKLEFCRGECDEGFRKCEDGHCIPSGESCEGERMEVDCRESMNWDHKECYEMAGAATHGQQLCSFLVAVTSILLIAGF